MSRLCVKNIPKYVEESRLRELFSKKGTVTDVKILRRPDGKSRQFAFVGFRSDSEAQSALKYFHGSYLDTCRLQLQVAQPRGEVSDRPWSKYSRGSSAYERRNARGTKRSLSEKEKARGKSKKTRKADAATANNKNSVEDALEDDSGAEGGVAVSRDGADGVGSGDEAGGERPREGDEAAGDSSDGNTPRLFVRNLCYSTTEEELAQEFRRQGRVHSVEIVMDLETKRSKGYGYVTMGSGAEAAAALNKLDGAIFQGRLLHVIPANAPPPKETPPGAADGGDAGSYKERQLRALQADSGNADRWNPLFMRSDAVLDAVAHSLGVSRRALLDPDAGNLAARVAVAETRIVNETKQHLEDSGISLDAVQAGNPKRIPRSTTAILVKGIPFTTTTRDLDNLFGRYGDVERVVLPPSRTIAVVVMSHPGEARSAFTSLAWTKFKDGKPLLLEWLPSQALVAKPTPKEKAGEQEGAAATAPVRHDDDDDDDATEAASTIHVNNLNFETGEEPLRAIFEALCPVRSVTIATKKLTDGTTRSRGYGFVELSSKQDALRCIKKLQGTRLEGHRLELSYSKSSASSTGSSSSSKRSKRKGVAKIKPGKKLMIRNIAFEATRKDIRDLFSEHGELKSVRLPKRMDGRHKGFCFVEFLSKRQAKSACEQLQNTHLYGRRLVIEYANPAEKLE